MEKELAKLKEVVLKVTNSNLDEDTKKVVLGVLRQRIFDLGREISIMNKNIEFVQEKGK